MIGSEHFGSSACGGEDEEDDENSSSSFGFGAADSSIMVGDNNRVPAIETPQNPRYAHPESVVYICSYKV